MCVKTVNHLCNKSTCTLQEISLEGGGAVHILCIFKDKEIKACHRFYSTPKQQWYVDTVDTVAVATVCCFSAGILHTNSLQSTLRKQGKRERNKQEEEAGEGGGVGVWGGVKWGKGCPRSEMSLAWGKRGAEGVGVRYWGKVLHVYSLSKTNIKRAP